MTSIPSLRQRIADYDAKLAALTPDDKRVKKRIFAKLGKLNKELLQLEQSSDTKKRKREVIGVGSSNDFGEIDCEGEREDEGEGEGEGECESEEENHAQETAQPLRRKQIKAKVKSLNRDLATLAQKKQLTGKHYKSCV